MMYFTQTYGQDTGYQTKSIYIGKILAINQTEKKRDIHDISIEYVTVNRIEKYIN